jgi:hypothetical protein
MQPSCYIVSTGEVNFTRIWQERIRFRRVDFCRFGLEVTRVSIQVEGRNAEKFPDGGELFLLS